MLSPVFLTTAILTGVIWNLKVLLTFMMIKNIGMSLSLSQPPQIPLMKIIALDLNPFVKLDYLVF